MAQRFVFGQSGLDSWQKAMKEKEREEVDPKGLFKFDDEDPSLSEDTSSNPPSAPQPVQAAASPSPFDSAQFQPVSHPSTWGNTKLEERQPAVDPKLAGGKEKASAPQSKQFADGDSLYERLRSVGIPVQEPSVWSFEAPRPESLGWLRSGSIPGQQTTVQAPPRSFGRVPTSDVVPVGGPEIKPLSTPAQPEKLKEEPSEISAATASQDKTEQKEGSGSAPVKKPAQVSRPSSTNPFDHLDAAAPQAPAPSSVIAQPQNKGEEPEIVASLPGEKIPQVALIPSTEIKKEDTLISDLEKLKAVMAPHKRTLFPVKFLKALKKLHDEIDQVMVQYAYANMVDAEEKANFKATEKTYYAMRSKYKGTSGIKEGQHPYKEAKEAYVDACNTIKLIALSPRLKKPFVSSQEYKDLRKISQDLKDFLEAYTSVFSSKKADELRAKKQNYGPLADNLNMMLSNLQNYSHQLPGHYSWKKTLLGALLIAAGVVAMGLAAAGAVVGFVPGIAIGLGGFNLTTAGLTALGIGFFAGGVTATVKGARKGVAQANQEFVELAAKDIKDRLPRSARSSIKP